MRKEVTQKLEPEDRIDANRYYEGSPIYPPKFKYDWNRSYIMEPAGAPRGAVVLLHGLTDSPYSLRHIARRYRDDGYVAIAIRLPGHGSVPAGLSAVHWEDWSEATRLAVREARRRIGPSLPLHMIGFSNGGALAMKYALDALGDKSLSRPDRIMLISPMIGITSLARFAGVFGWPAIFPAFARAAWLGVVPEFNPFKYNSFPVNAARQSSLTARILQQQIARYAGEGRLGELPPILTFQSVVDFTVSTRAIVNALYVHLPANGSELVLFDLNRNAKFGPLLRASTDNILVASAAAAAAQLQDRDHHQRQLPQRRSRRARYRARRDHRADARAGHGLSQRGIFAFAPGAAVSAERFALWHEAGLGRGFRRGARRDGDPRRARHADRQHGFADTHVVQSVLPVPDGAGRRRHRGAQSERQRCGRCRAGCHSSKVAFGDTSIQETAHGVLFVKSHLLRDFGCRMARHACALGAGLAAMGPACADEGVWAFDSPPAKVLQSKYEFMPSVAWLDALRLSAVRLGGGSGSFVSRDGLVLTNHHVIMGCLQALSTRADDLVENGFYARTRSEERTCPGLELRRLEATEDVTEKVRAAVKSANDVLATAERNVAIAALEAACKENTGLQCEMVTLYRGAAYHLYRYTIWNDVRLVFAPEASVGSFGGDPDNFVFPRFELDFSLVRVYEKGEAIKPLRFLKWANTGLKDGDLVFAAGHPGSTDRLLTLAQLTYNRDIRYPLALASANRARKVLQEYSARSPESARRAADKLVGTENWLKAMTGEYKALREPELMAAKADEESRLRKSFVPTTDHPDPWATIEVATTKRARDTASRWVVGYGYETLFRAAGRDCRARQRNHACGSRSSGGVSRVEGASDHAPAPG